MDVSLLIFKKNGGGFRTLLFVWYGSENKIMVFNNENNNLNLLAAYYFSFMVHLWLFIGFLTHRCWFYFWCIFSTNIYGPVDVCLLEVGSGALGWGVGCGRSWWWRHHSDVNGVVLVSLLVVWTCFALPCAVFVFAFGDVGVCGALFVVNTYLYIFIVVLEPQVD